MTAPTSSPSKHNPFAARTDSTTFTRTSLLPARRLKPPPPTLAEKPHPTHAGHVSQTADKGNDRPNPKHMPKSRADVFSASVSASPLTNPATKADTTPTATAKTLATPGTKATPRRQAWRLLWRGGLEVGPDGWRLDGVTFVAHLAFPATPSASTKFASPAPAPAAFGDSTSGLSLPTADTDLCLSLESMRGRKYLPIRGVVPLADDDIEVDDAGVQMSITAPLLAAFFTGLLCRNPKLSPQDKTTTGVVIGLGDEGVDPTSSMIVYGQRQAEAGSQPTLRLCVGRRRVVAPPSAKKKIRPGEPLPRAPIMFPKAPKRPPPPIPRSISRATSVSSIYAPPPGAGPRLSASSSTSAALDALSDSRRGQKRPLDEPDDRRRKSGRLDEEDIFGSRRASAPRVSAASDAAPRASTASDAAEAEKPAQSQQVTDNKNIIRKQTLTQLESRGCPRSHQEFNDVFSSTTKGVYFALRKDLERPLDKARARELVSGHLDMYLPEAEEVLSDETELSPEVRHREMRTPSPSPRA